MAHVLLIEDDAGIRTAVIRALNARGHAVDAAVNGLDGLQMLLTQDPEVLILDLGLPDVPGERLLGMIRAVSQIPVIVATARDEGAAIVGLLDAGADDYLVKPYDPAQLEARIRAVLRRAGTGESESTEPPLRVGGLRLDRSRRTAEVDGRVLELTRLEYDVLAYLATNPGRVVSRKELLREVWQRTDSVRTVDVHLSWLRRKLGDDADDPRFIHVHRGVGVLLEDRSEGAEQGVLPSPAPADDPSDDEALPEGTRGSGP